MKIILFKIIQSYKILKIKFSYKIICKIYNFIFINNIFILVNGEYITACNHDDAVNILRNAGDIVVLTVKHYRAAKPFLQKNGKYHLINFKHFFNNFDFK